MPKVDTHERMVSITSTMMRKLIHTMMLLAFVTPAVSCFCSPPAADRAMACDMDESSSCCCETEVQTPASPQAADMIAPAILELPELVASAIPVSELLVAREGVSLDSSDPKLQIYSPPQIYLTHQSFLI
jgi:hypothetical protein